MNIITTFYIFHISGWNCHVLTAPIVAHSREYPSLIPAYTYIVTLHIYLDIVVMLSMNHRLILITVLNIVFPVNFHYSKLFCLRNFVYLILLYKSNPVVKLIHCTGDSREYFFTNWNFLDITLNFLGGTHYTYKCNDSRCLGL